MKDTRKPEAIIAELRRELVTERAEYKSQQDYVLHQRAEIAGLLSRANVAERDRDEWKRRFDALLAAIPELRKVTA